MREILFRGKRIDTGEWVSGHYSEGSPDYHYITNRMGMVAQVDPATVGQFTGLAIGETKIFEGDIIKDEGVVVWMYEALGWFVNRDGYYTPLYDLPIIIVTGNIHDTQQEGGQL